VLCWLVYRAFYNQRYLPFVRRAPLLGAFLFSVVYGVMDEYHQRHVPGRISDVNDLLADAGGALLFVGIAWLVIRRNGSGGTIEKS
jgi:VanZ family protein